MRKPKDYFFFAVIREHSAVPRHSTDLAILQIGIDFGSYAKSLKDIINFEIIIKGWYKICMQQQGYFCNLCKFGR